MGVVDVMQKDFDHEIIEEFAGHYTLMCDEMEGLMLGLEKENTYARNVGELFRIFHNIKSASGFLHLGRMNTLSELVESIFEEARIKKGPATAEFVNWLLAIKDQFDKWRIDIEYNHDDLATINPKIIAIPQKITLDS